MASIVEAITANEIKNGTILVGNGLISPTFQTIDTYVDNNPNIGILSTKYDDRFNDPRYYSGDAAT